MTTFTDLGLAAPLLKALAKEGYEQPTPIQAKAIPPVMTGTDLLGIAQTGTGKTAAFALPILHRLIANRRAPLRKGCRVLVLSPTRELATQIAESFRAYGRFFAEAGGAPLSVAVVFGGVSHGPQISALSRGVDVLVATPGRLLDHMGERNISIEGTEIFVLDEADQMLDLGFVRPIRQIVAKLATRRQSLFFSATMPGEIGKLADELLKEPVKVSVAPAATTVERVSQRVIHVEQNRKRALLVELLSDPAMARTLVFTRTKRGADRVAGYLEVAGIVAAAIHGNKSQRQRELALDSFRAAKTRVLVATDIAARGIDIDAVSHVINFELPDVPESYVHRIGRTARAGAEGAAISLVDAEERMQLRDIERLTRQTIPSEDRRADTSLAADPAGKASGRRPGGRSGAERAGRPGGRGHDGAGDRNPRDRRDERRGDPRREHRAGDRDRTGPRGDDRRPESARDGEPRRTHTGPSAPRRDDRPHASGRPAHAGDRGHRHGTNGNGHTHAARDAHGHGQRPRRDEGAGRNGERRGDAAGHSDLSGIRFMKRPGPRGAAPAGRGRPERREHRRDAGRS